MALAVTPGTGTTLKSSLSGADHVVHHNIDTLPAVSNTGTFPVQETGAALTALQLIDDAIVTLAAAIAAAKGHLIAGTDGTNARAIAVTAAGLVKVDDGGGSLSVDDGASSLTVDDGGLTLSIDDGAGSLTVDGTVAISGTVPVSGPATDAQLRATPLPVSGTVAVSGTVPVSGPLTDAQVRATALPVSGPATDAQLRATPLPVSGNVGITGSAAVTGPLTDTQLRAAAVAIAEGGAALTALQLIDDMIVAQAAAIASAKVALAGGSDGTSARALKVTSAGLLQIDSLPAGAALIGRTDLSLGGTAVSAAVPVPTTPRQATTFLPTMGTQAAAAHAAGNFVDGKITLANFAPVSGGSGLLQYVKVLSKTPFTGAFWVVVFNADPTGTTFGDNTAGSIADADLGKIIGVVKCDNVFNLVAGSVHQSAALAIPFRLAATSAWAAIITVAAITTTSTSDIALMLETLPD